MPLPKQENTDEFKNEDEKISIVVGGKKSMQHEREKLRMIVELQENSELKETFVNFYNTVALVAALFLAFLVAPSGYEVEVHSDSLCSSADAVVGCTDTYNLAMAGTLILCLFLIFLCVTLIVQFGHVPGSASNLLIEEFGMGLVQGPGIIMVYMIFAFCVTLVLNFALTMRHWVGAVSIAMLVVVLGSLPFLGSWMINMKMKVLRRLHNEEVEKEKKKKPKKKRSKHAPPDEEDYSESY